jgi:hypothetical protein
MLFTNVMAAMKNFVVTVGKWVIALFVRKRFARNLYTVSVAQKAFVSFLLKWSTWSAAEWCIVLSVWLTNDVTHVFQNLFCGVKMWRLCGKSYCCVFCLEVNYLECALYWVCGSQTMWRICFKNLFCKIKICRLCEKSYCDSCQEMEHWQCGSFCCMHSEKASTKKARKRWSFI